MHLVIRGTASSSSSTGNPDVPINPPVKLYSFDVVVRFGKGHVLDEDVGVVAAGGRPVVDVAVAGVVRGQGAIDRAVALQALGEVEAAELDVLFGVIQVFLAEVLDAQGAGDFGTGLGDDLGQTFGFRDGLHIRIEVTLLVHQRREQQRVESARFRC